MPIPPRDAVTFLLEPELHMLAGVNAAAAEGRRSRMRESPASFYRGANALSALWMVNHLPSSIPWVWAVGDAHPGNFATLAVGPQNRDGISPVRFDVADVDDEHPAPWCWDAVRLLAGFRLQRPDLDAGELNALAEAHLDEYRRTIADNRAGDPRWTRIDLDGLPEPLKTTIGDESLPARRQSHMAELVDGNRLRRGKKAQDAAGKDWLIPTLKAVWARAEMPEFEIQDIVERLAGGGVSSRGRRRWLVLVKERVRVEGEARWSQRVVELKERRPSVLARWVPASPFPAMGQAAATVPMGRDPYHAVVPAAPDPLLARTRCHCRTPIDLTACDAGDLTRAARLYGQILAAFHCRGLMHLAVDRNPLAAADKPAAKDLTGWAEALAAWNREAAAEFGVVGAAGKGPVKAKPAAATNKPVAVKAAPAKPVAAPKAAAAGPAKALDTSPAKAPARTKAGGVKSAAKR
jgi:uncharacterized protein (DUF2252 family)